MALTTDLDERLRRGDMEDAAWDALLEHDASIDAHDARDDTLLCVASSLGHEDVARRILAHDVSADVADVLGDSLLLFASRCDHTTVVEVLLEHDANPDAVNEDGETTVIAASRAGHMDVVKLLLSTGAAVDACAFDDETLLTAAARWRHTHVLLDAVERASASQGEAMDRLLKLLLVSLRALRESGSAAHVFSGMLDGVVVRLTVFVYNQEAADISSSTLRQCAMIAAALIRLKAYCESDSVLRRVTACRAVLSSIRDLHIEMDRLLADLDEPEYHDRRQTLRDEEDSVIEIFASTLGDDEQLTMCAEDNGDHDELTALLQQEIRRAHGDQSSSRLLSFLKSTLEQLSKPTSDAAGALPPWFLSGCDVTVESATARTKGEHSATSLLPGKWLNSGVSVLELESIPCETFVTALDRWSQWKHPNVVRLFGASHLRQPPVAIFEKVTSLREFLRTAPDRSVLWQKLYEAALGLKYLHERQVVLGLLQWESIWIAADGVAKVFAVEVYFAGESGVISGEIERWIAPEALNTELPTPASDVFSFGKLIEAALVGEDALREIEQPADSDSVVPDVSRRLEYLSIPQWRLTEGMCVEDPVQRLSLLYVIEHLRRFAEESREPIGEEAVVEQNNEQDAADLQTYVFPELGSTIGDRLNRLRARCSLYHESDDSVKHILNRLFGTFRLLQKHGTLPHDVAAVQFCKVLYSFRRLIQAAFSERSIAELSRTQRVALKYDLPHREIDDVLQLLPTRKSFGVKSVHYWRRHTASFDEEIWSEGGDSAATVSIESRSPEEERRLRWSEIEVEDEVVQLRESDPETGNSRFKAVIGEDMHQSSWFIPVDKISYESYAEIGCGAFAKVLRGVWLNSPVVIKFLGFEEDSGGQVRKLFLHELRVWQPLNHPHVLKLFGACHVHKLWFVCEDATHGTLIDFLRKDSNKAKVWPMLYEAALGLQYLHSQNIVHNDLKCSNLFIGADRKTKVADFGLACILNSVEVQIEPKNQGATHWKSPEYLRGERVTLASDIYSFGMCIVEAVTGCYPWAPSIDAAVRRFVRLGRLPQKPTTMTDLQWRLIELMCHPEPHDRLQIPSVVAKLRAICQQLPPTHANAILEARDSAGGLHEEVTSLPEDVLPTAESVRKLLDALVRRAGDVHEYEPMWCSVVGRLQQLDKKMPYYRRSQDPVDEKFLSVIRELLRIRSICESPNLVNRLVSYRSVTSIIQEVHKEVDYLLRVDIDEMINSSEQYQWRGNLIRDRSATLEKLRSALDGRIQFWLSPDSEADQIEAIALIQTELCVHGDKTTQKHRRLLRSALDRVRRLARSDVAETPIWYLAAHELDFEQASNVEEGGTTTTRVVRGKWQSSNVSILQSTMPQADFVRAIDLWYPLSHPNVAQLFGATHLRHSKVAVVEGVTSLRAYVAAEANHCCVWRALHEAALGLRYLHERGMVLETLHWDNFWIGADDLAMIVPLSASCSSHKSCGTSDGVEHWRSPEMRRGEAPTPASDIFAFGKLIKDAMIEDAASARVDARLLFQLQEIEIMCASEPVQRGNMLFVVEHLKKFADEVKQRTATSENQEPDSSIKNLRDFVAPTLELTIEAYVAKLKSKCACCKDFRGDVAHVHRRLVDISSYLHKTSTEYEHVAVTKFCCVLRDVNWFLDVSIGNDTSAVRAQRNLSRKVTVDSKALHKQLDEVMALIPMADANMQIHTWTRSSLDILFEGTNNGVGEQRKPASGPRKKSFTRVENSTQLEDEDSRFKAIDLHDSSQVLSPWYIPVYEVKFSPDDRIGYAGAFGEVFRGTWLRTPVLIKSAGYDEDHESMSTEMFAHELRVWWNLNHPHVIRLFGACHRDNRYFVYEDVPGTTLLEFLAEAVNRSKIWRKLYEVALGIQYLHELNVIHNDLRCANFLIGADGSAKITEFGQSSIINITKVHLDAKQHSALEWKSPECLRGDRVTLASDVYSFGLCILEAVTGNAPWERNAGINAAIRRPRALHDASLPLRPVAMRDDQWSLVQLMCAKEPTKRVTIATVVDRLCEFAHAELQL